MPPNTAFTKSEAIPPDATFDPSSLKEKSIIITGGASGIGEACLRTFVNAGAFVTFGDVADDRGESLVTELGLENVAFVHCDVTSWEDQLRLFKTSLSASPSKTIDIVLANAGINRSDTVFTQDALPNGDPLEPNLSVVQTNLIGAMYTAKLALFYFPKQDPTRDHCLILTGSISSYMDQPRSPQYNAAKWGLRGLLRSLRHTGPDQGIRVDLIAPWFVDTRIMPDGAKTMMAERGIEFVEIGDAASAVLHFASDNAVNGRALSIVPRSVHHRGYLDLELDDLQKDDLWGFVEAFNSSVKKDS